MGVFFYAILLFSLLRISMAFPRKEYIWAAGYALAATLLGFALAAGPAEAIFVSMLIHLAILAPLAFGYFWLMPRLEPFSAPWFAVGLIGAVLLTWFAP